MRALSARRTLALVGEDRRDGARDVALERYFDEDQRLIHQRRMKERITTPVGWIDTAAQIFPVVNLVHGFVADDFLEYDRRR